MSIAIIIATHGVAAEQLLKTTEMLIGEQPDVAYIDFVPGENAETIMGKYQALVEGELSHCDQVLFLVDMWGGSPFNAANRFQEGKNNMDVVTGVNIPMLVNACMARDDVESLEELVEVALEAGATGVRSLNHQPAAAEPVAPAAQEPAAPTPQPQIADDGRRMTIALARIDDRLIHGQVATVWTKESKVKRIIVVNDDVAKDKVRSTMLKSVAPLGVTAHVVDVAKMIRVYNNPEYADDRVMLLFTNPSDVLSLIEGGVPLTSINVGGISHKEGKQMVSHAVAVDQKDIDAFKAIDAKGVELEVRKVSSDSRQAMMDLLKKNNLI
ncbi:PTS mannose transporter subunit IIAB [Actinobacillus capsulatus]|uniref:PTS mannose transporter subunit IIAB n=1 Tax=Actinobacillus capsulatus TaxID=717 RepID=UPI000365AC85|nr:PTS mannose transporter subunit IIAB [Actinobacillus capsulatus]